ncbi:MAG: S8 family serine peptidase [Desulfuromonadales bacterium]
MTRIGVIDTGINPWHSHIRGGVTGLRIYLDSDGRIQEDDDFRDLVGHGTAVAGILRQQLPEVELFAIRVFEQDLSSYPSLVARAVLRAAAEGCSILNLSLGMSSGPGSELLTMACREVMEAGCIIVAAGHPDNAALLPASIPGVFGVIADDRVPFGEIRIDKDLHYPYAASGSPRDLEGLQTSDNLWGNSFACARVTAHMADVYQVKKGDKS